jgi:hypothetical protein
MPADRSGQCMPVEALYPAVAVAFNPAPPILYFCGALDGVIGFYHHSGRKAPRTMTSAEFQARWAKIMARVEALPLAARQHGLVANWEDIPEILIRIGQPASAAEILAVETTLPSPIPQSLKQVFLLGCRSFHIMWSWPGSFIVTPGGWGEVQLRDFPPEPNLSSGYISWGQDEIVSSRDEWIAWIGALQEEPADGVNTLHARTHKEHQHAQLWQRSFPVANVSIGDVFAIDLQSSREEMILLHHERDDRAGWRIGRTFLEWMGHESRLGFMSIELRIFVTSGATSDSATPNAVVLDADRPAGVAWRNVFWRGLPAALYGPDA